MRKVLHVGCATDWVVGRHKAFPAGEWTEVRLDIDPAMRPDIVASMTDMPMVGDASCDAVFSSHNLEHLFLHELRRALAEFLRVLKSGGFLLARVPDIEIAARAIAAGRIEEPLYESPSGPITPLDVIFGHRRSIAKGMTYMAHRNGFVAASLGSELDLAGFVGIQIGREHFDLAAMAYKDHRPAGALRLTQRVPKAAAR